VAFTALYSIVVINVSNPGSWTVTGSVIMFDIQNNYFLFVSKCSFQK